MIRQVHHVLRREDRRELLGKTRRIGRSEPEGNQRADVSEDSVANLRRELAQVLVSEHQADGVLAQLGQHPGKGTSGEALLLIEVKEEGATTGGRNLGTGERRRPEGGDEEGAQEIGCSFADPPRGEIGEKDAARSTQAEILQQGLRRWAFGSIGSRGPSCEGKAVADVMRSNCSFAVRQVAPPSERATVLPVAGDDLPEAMTPPAARRVPALLPA